MASSMTGLGLGEVQKNGIVATVELRSVNNRFLEISCKMPSFLSHYEAEVKEIIRTKLKRGKVYATISVQGETNEILGIRVAPRMILATRHLLDELRKTAGVKEELKLEHFLKFSEIFESTKEPEGAEKTWDYVKDALKEALADLKEMRDREGEVLAQDILGRIQILEEHVAAIEKITEVNLPDAYKRMVERVSKLIKDREIDQERLNTEIVLMADKMDITEECVRLRSHNQLFFQILQQEPVVGKKLNFLLQEMNREANTISSKAINAEISHHVVEMKEEIEKLREQVQNLE